MPIERTVGEAHLAPEAWSAEGVLADDHAVAGTELPVGQDLENPIVYEVRVPVTASWSLTDCALRM